jgi:hypothetical protein
VLHGQNPLAYLTALLSHPHAIAAAPADWMPWNYSQTLAGMTAAPVDANLIPDTQAAGATPADSVPLPEPPTSTSTGKDITAPTAATTASSAAPPLPTAH